MFTFDFHIAGYTLRLPLQQSGVPQQQLFPVAIHIFHPQVVPDELAPSTPQTREITSSQDEVNAASIILLF